MKEKMKYFLFAFVTVLALFGVFALAKPLREAKAADYSYTPGVDGISFDAEGNLLIDFTVEESVQGSMISWVVYLFSADAQLNFEYDSYDHKYYDSASTGRDAANYYFITNNSTSSGHIQVKVNKTDHAYSGGPMTTPNATDYLEYDTDKTFVEVANENNWYISIGPLWNNPWTGGKPSYNVDYYVARGNELPDYNSTVYFRDFDGTLLTSKSYYLTNVHVDTPVSYTKDLNKEWAGWYCDATKQTYAELSNVQELMVSDILPSTNIANFYATYKRGNGDYIEFTPVSLYEGNYTQDQPNDTILLASTDTPKTVNVVYHITHNDGVNSILLLPEYETSVFTLTNVSVDNTTSLGLATLTNNGFDKILLESENVYSGLNDAFITMTFRIDNPKDGDYKFGLKLAPYVHNEVTEAYYWLDGSSLGEQAELEVRVVDTQSTVRVLTIKEAKIEIGKSEYSSSYDFGYAGQTVTVAKVDTLSNVSENLKVEYTYNGTATPVVQWYESYGWDYQNNCPEKGNPISAPKNAGTYIVGISAPSDGMYNAVSEQLREVYINKAYIEIAIDNKTSSYGSDIANLTYTVTYGTLYGEDSLNIVLGTTATKSSNVGDYNITITNPTPDYNEVRLDNYDVYFSNGTYTITPVAITIQVGSGESSYTGEELSAQAVQALGYTSTYTGTEDDASSITNGWTIELQKAPGTHVGQYSVTAVIESSVSNFNVTIIDGTYVITSITGYDFLQHFEGLTLTYSASQQDLLRLNLPQWLTTSEFVAQNNLQTNVGTYPITITITLSQENASSYNGGSTDPIVLQVTGKINPYALNIAADNKGHTYGSEAQTLTPQEVEGAGEEVLEVSFIVKQGLSVVTPSATTPVGVYTIYPSVNNSNYDFTFVPGLYTVSKASVSLSVSASNIKYNKPLNYSISATVGTLTLTSDDYTVVFKDNNNNVVDPTTVLDAEHLYTISVTVDGTTNYNGNSQDAQFFIFKETLLAPEISYDKATATWAAVTKDSEGVLLHNSTVSYSINETAISGDLSYTATSKDELTLTITPSNTNYEGLELELASVLLVQYSEGEHSANANSASDMPANEYLFAGQKATAPQTNPTLTGYTFNQWELSNQAYDFDLAVTSDLTIVAKWNVIQYTITFKYTDASGILNTDMFELLLDYNSTISSALAPANPTKVSDNLGIYYTFNNKWLNGELYQANGNGNLAANNEEYKVLGNATFVAQYDMHYNSFRVSYYVKEVGAEQFAALPEYTVVTYLNAITLEALSSDIHWFAASAWYLDQALSQAVPQTMPNHDINVYAEIRFNVGQGDVNGNGSVDANDITLYRQYIVGGYDIETVGVGYEWAIANDFDTDALYFLERVADNNNDLSKDIRDISITRMAIVGGYSWNIEAGANVSGQAIIRTVSVATLNALVDVLESGNRAKLAGDLTEELGVLNVSSNQNIYIDLNGHTLTLKSLTLNETGYLTITVKNGTIVTKDGITLTAENGNVVIDDVTAYDENGLVQLQAASNSLHLSGNVEFRHGNKEVSTPAAVKIEQGTHVVVEKEATLVVEKLVVTESFEVPTTVNQLVITLDYFGDEEIEVEGVVGGYTLINTLSELYEAAIAGGKYQLNDDFSFSGSNNRVYVYNDMVLDLNGHTVTSTNEIPFAVVNHATLVIEGEGQVNGVESCVMAFGASEFIINGGTYTCTDNFVFGTNGSSGQGGNSITINNGIFNGGIISAGYVACGIYVANDDTVTVNGGTFNITHGVGILSRCGNTTVNGGTFNVIGNGTEGKVGDSRVVVPSGKVLVLDLAAHYPANKPSLVNNSTYAVYTIVSSDSELREALGYDHLGVVLVNDINCGDNDIVVSKTHNIDLNGHNITFTNWGFEVRNGSTLTFDDSKGTGSVSSVEATLYAQYGGHLVVNAGIYNATDNFVVGTHGSNGSGNTITINGGTFNGFITSAGYVACGIYVANDDTVTINAGTFNITNGVGILARSGNTTIKADAVFTVTGDGTLGKIGDSRVVLPAGEVLVVDYAANYPGGTPELVNNTKYEVYALVDDEASLVAANEFADTIVFSKDIEITEELVVSRTVMLNLNGHKLFNESVDIWNDDNGTYGLIGVSGGNLTIDGNGEIIAKSWDCYAIEVWGNGTLTINSGRIGGNCHAVYMFSGTTTVNGGYFYVDQPTTNPVPYGYVLNCLDARYQAGEAHIIVNGGQFENFNPADCAAEAAHTSFLGEGEYTVTSVVVSETKTVYTVTQTN